MFETPIVGFLPITIPHPDRCVKAIEGQTPAQLCNFDWETVRRKATMMTLF
jgi:hypothetical protein